MSPEVKTNLIMHVGTDFWSFKRQRLWLNKVNRNCLISVCTAKHGVLATFTLFTYSPLLMTWTLATLNLALTKTKVDFPWILFYTFTVFFSHIYCNFILGNSYFLLTQSNFCFPADHFHFLTPNNWNNVLRVWQVEKKCSVVWNIQFIS